MKFTIRQEIFDKLPDMYVGVVVADGIDNRQDYPQVEAMLEKYNNYSKEKFAGANIKEREEIIPYREAFRKIDINPNRYPCSAEAMFKRLAKGHDLPHINPLVDLNNAISLKYTVPMGTHKLDNAKEDILMRLAEAGDKFVPLGKDQVEEPDEGEVVYAVGHEVRTRRWTWRQSEYGKIDADTTQVFFPIDGFTDVNAETVRQAQADLQKALKDIFGVDSQAGIVDIDHPSFEWQF